MHYVRQDESMKSFYCSFYSFIVILLDQNTLFAYIFIAAVIMLNGWPAMQIYT